MLVEMEFRQIQIVIDVGGAQEVVLGEKGGSRLLPIYIGFFEATFMENALRQRSTSRPLTHDLIYNIIDGLNCKIKYVMINELADKIFYGKVAIENEKGDEVLIDSRPSDALVLAAKRQIPIYVEEEVLDEVSRDLQGE